MEPSPASSPLIGRRWPSPSNGRRRRLDSKDSTDSKDLGKVSKKMPYRKRYEDITTAEMLSAGAGDVTMTSSATVGRSRDPAGAARTPVKCDIPVPPATEVTTLSTAHNQLAADQLDSDFTASTSSIASEVGQGQVRGQIEPRSRPRLKLPSTPVGGPFQALMTTPTTPTTPTQTTPTRPQPIKIQLSELEQVLVARRYDGPAHAAVGQAVDDVTRLMTSSLLATPTDDDVTPADKGSGSGELGVAAVDGCAGRAKALLSSGSFRRTELVPSVRRFVSFCDRLVAAMLDQHGAHAEFGRHLTDSVRAFVVVLAVSRRAQYAANQRRELNAALRGVGVAYCAVVTAAGPAMSHSGTPVDQSDGRCDDSSSLMEQARARAAELANQLSALLSVLRNIRPQPHSRIAFF